MKDFHKFEMVAGTPWPRRLWAAADGLAAWTFLMLGYIGLSGVMRLSMVEVNKLNLDVANPPEAFTWLIVLAPEPGWCLLLGITLLALAYARVAWTQNQGLTTGRLFFGAVIMLEFLLLIAILPLIGRRPLPPMIEDVHWLDEVVFLFSATALCLGCFWFTRTRSKTVRVHTTTTDVVSG